jgi:uncharacterized membrane protein YhaH (DUF805 family)
MAVQFMSSAAGLFSFKGRITRGEWWALQVLVCIIVGVAIYLRIHTGNAEPHLIAHLAGLLLNVAGLWIGLAAAARRFHDRGKSGWNALWQLLPIIGSIYILYACGITENGREPNKYGAPIAV